MQNFYVVRDFSIAFDSFIQLDEERAFLSYESALEYVKSAAWDSTPNASDLARYFSEIVEFEIDDAGKTVLIRTRRYNVRSECINISEDKPGKEHHYPPDPPGKPKDWKPRFKVGDLVRLKMESPFHHHYMIPLYGVVGMVPQSFEEWEQKFPEHEWETNYFFSYIDTDSGMLNHAHPEEEDLEAVRWKDLPEEMEFLRRLACHFNGNKPFSDEVYRDLCSGKYYLLNKKSYRDIPDTD